MANILHLLSEHWDVLAFLAGAFFFVFSALKYKLPNIESKMKDLEENMKKYMEEMSKQFVRRNELFDVNDNPKFQPARMCEQLHKHLCTTLESMSSMLQRKLDEFDQKREDTRTEISRLYTEVANVVARTNSYMESRERRTSEEIAQEIARVVADKMCEAVTQLNETHKMKKGYSS